MHWAVWHSTKFQCIKQSLYQSQIGFLVGFPYSTPSEAALKGSILVACNNTVDGQTYYPVYRLLSLTRAHQHMPPCPLILRARHTARQSLSIGSLQRPVPALSEPFPWKLHIERGDQAEKCSSPWETSSHLSPNCWRARSWCASRCKMTPCRCVLYCEIISAGNKTLIKPV